MATMMLTTTTSERGLKRKLQCDADEKVQVQVSEKTNKIQEKPSITKNNNNNNKRRGKSSFNPEQNNNVKRKPGAAVDNLNKDEMLATYQPWVIQTYGDLAKTKTVTLKKYARILRTLRGEEAVSADNSKFRFWVKAKGFCVGQPAGYEAKPADAIVGRYSVCDADEGISPVNNGAVAGKQLLGSAKDPPLYVPNAPFKNSTGEPVYRKVAVVENFFDIIYNVHVELEGRPGKHAGQKRTYRTITETYAFLPREAVTRFLLGCTECQKHPRSPSPSSLLPTPSPSPTLPALPPSTHPHQQTPFLPLTAITSYCPAGTPADTAGNKSPARLEDIKEVPTPQRKLENALGTLSDPSQRPSHPLDVCNLTSRDPTPPKKRHLHHLSEYTSNPPAPAPPASKAAKLWSPVKSIEQEQLQGWHKATKNKAMLMAACTDIDYSLPITTTYLKYMRSLGCTDEDALKFDNKHENLSTPESSENNEEDHFTGSGAMKDSDKLKLMLLAWNYHNQAQGNRNGSGGGGGEIPDLSAMPGGEEMAGLWAQYHTALGLAKGKATPPSTRDQSSPVNAETGSAHDETSSSGNKEDEDDDDDESDDKIDTQAHDPERLKAFNMFVRLFVDENLDRMVPISKQPKEKIQAIIDSCTRQFPEFAERARKRIRTYLKSCRRNKRARDPNSPWDASRPTPAHLTSVQAEQILATACENESHNAKRMRLGLEPVSQPMPVLPGAQPTDTTAPINRGLDFSNSTPVKMETDTVATVFPSSTTTPSSTPNSVTKSLSLTPDTKTPTLGTSCTSTLGTSAMNGIGITSSSTSAGSAPTAMYRPNFSQAFQRAGPYPLFPASTPFGSNSGLLTNGPADLSMKQKPLLNHKLSTGEMAAVRQLITGYRESAAFLLRSADELEQLLLQQQ